MLQNQENCNFLVHLNPSKEGHINIHIKLQQSASIRLFNMIAIQLVFYPVIIRKTPELSQPDTTIVTQSTILIPYTNTT